MILPYEEGHILSIGSATCGDIDQGRHAGLIQDLNIAWKSSIHAMRPDGADLLCICNRTSGSTCSQVNELSVIESELIVRAGMVSFHIRLAGRRIFWHGMRAQMW